MSLIRGLEDRALRALLITAFLLLALVAGAMWWARHRDRTADARTRRALDSLTTLSAARRDSLARLEERYRADTARIRVVTASYTRASAALEGARIIVRRVDTVRLAALDSAAARGVVGGAGHSVVPTVPVLLQRADTVRVDTVAVVREFRLACTASIAVRDTALVTCAARGDAEHRLRVTDSTSAALRLEALARHAAADAHAASRRGFTRGGIVGALLTVGAAFALRQITR